MLPEGYAPRTTVNDYFNAWKRDGTLDEINGFVAKSYPPG